MQAQRSGRWVVWAAVVMVATLMGSVEAHTRHRTHRHHHVQRHRAPVQRHTPCTSCRQRRHHCHCGAHKTSQAGGLHPLVRARLSAALSELRRRGVRPRITSTYRSVAQQRQLFRCAQSRRCRLRRGVYGAKAPGHSMHEAGLAVDIAGIAVPGRGRRRHLTGAGATIVRVMRRHDFSWRYGLHDPAHFELSPRQVGYRNASSAIHAHRVASVRRHRAHLLTLRSVGVRYRARAPRPWATPRV